MEKLWPTPLDSLVPPESKFGGQATSNGQRPPCTSSSHPGLLRKGGLQIGRELFWRGGKRRRQDVTCRCYLWLISLSTRYYHSNKMFGSYARQTPPKARGAPSGPSNGRCPAVRCAQWPLSVESTAANASLARKPPGGRPLIGLRRGCVGQDWRPESPQKDSRLSEQAGGEKTLTKRYH